MRSSSSPHALSLGEPQPPKQVHSVSVSMPTWDSVVGWGKRDHNVVGRMQTVYPRFYIHRVLRDLAGILRKRLNVPEDQLDCMLFPSETTARRFATYLRKADTNKVVDSVTFYLPNSVSLEHALWGRFVAVFYHPDLSLQARKCWCILGDGISSRHGEFCLEQIDLMHSESSNAAFRTTAPSSALSKLPPVAWTDSARHEKEQMKKHIADLATSEKPGSQPVTADQVFLYSKGMVAINSVCRALFATLPTPEYSGAVVYGWPYAETPKAVEMAGFERFTLYGRGTVQELDELEATLKSGQRIRVLFCEVPCNPLLETPNLGRIRALADEYGFIVACDETLGTFVNIDLLPYVDILMTSLTKIFSGASNVMGGSTVVNPQSQHYESIQAALIADHEDEYFPTDAMVMADNSADFTERVQRCNHSAHAIANLLASHPSIHHVNYPTMVSSARFYKQYRRRHNSNNDDDDGGYGFLLSMIFHHPQSAVRFYDALDVCKGPSVGTNFTLAIPYAQLAHAQELDFAESFRVDKYIVRISVGLEDERELLERVSEALRVVEGESSPL